MAASVSERHAPTSRKYVAEKAMDILKFSEEFSEVKPRALSSRKYVPEYTKSNPKQFKRYELLWLHSSVFALEFYHQKC